KTVAQRVRGWRWKHLDAQPALGEKAFGLCDDKREVLDPRKHHDRQLGVLRMCRAAHCQCPRQNGPYECLARCNHIILPDARFSCIMLTRSPIVLFGGATEFYP